MRVARVPVHDAHMPTTPCPCGHADYAICCGRCHAGAIAATAEQLMRSRYSAYVLRLRDYLLATWHPDTRPHDLDLDDAASRATRWLGLEVRRQLEDGDHATVEFIARYRIGGASAMRLHEISRFDRFDGRWYYRDGEFVARR